MPHGTHGVCTRQPQSRPGYKQMPTLHLRKALQGLAASGHPSRVILSATPQAGSLRLPQMHPVGWKANTGRRKPAGLGPAEPAEPWTSIGVAYAGIGSTARQNTGANPGSAVLPMQTGCLSAVS